ncbi:MAG: hypothetical protein Q8T11_08115 [Elusimicrobiota bacterium]|nr:hypothetical protein [Elusimicrobiota bacterium]
MKVKLPNPLVAIVWCAFLLPDRLAGGRLDLPLAALAAIAGGASLWTMPSAWETREPAYRAALLAVALQLLWVISFLFALAFKGAQSGPLDWLDLPRWTILGVFLVHLIRQHGPAVREAAESAMAVAAYGSWLIFDSPRERFAAAALTLCYMILFSRSRLRLAHAAAALAALATAGFKPLVAIAPDVERLVRLSPVIGWGPARYELASATSPQYLHWLARGGALGACLIAAGLALVVRRLLRGEDDIRRRTAVAAFLSLAALLLLTGPLLDGYRFFFVLAFMAAAVHEPRGDRA